MLIHLTGIDFRKLSFAEAKELAQEQQKAIFVDFYADWCGPCKWMDKNVFVDETVGNFFNENFISIKVDTDLDTEYDLILELEISSIPTYGFFSPEGKLILSQNVSMKTEEFMDLASLILDRKKYISSTVDLSMSKNKLNILNLISSEDPAKSYDLAENYVKKLIVTDPTLENFDYTDWELIDKFVTKDWEYASWQSPIAYLDDIDIHLLENITEIIGNNWNDPLLNYYETTLDYLLNYIVNTKEEEKMELLNESYGTFIANRNEFSFPEKSYHEYNWIKYHLMSGNLDYFFEHSDEWLKKYHAHSNETYYYREMGELLSSHCQEQKCIDKAEELFLKAIELEDNDINNLMLVSLYYKTDQAEKLIPLLDKAARDLIDSDYYYLFEILGVNVSR